MEIVFTALFALLGMVVASFLNVCIDRLPVGGSLLFPPSHCGSCRHRLSVKDLIPIFSYLWLRGRCRYCHARIPRRVLWVELGSAVLFACLYWHYGLSAELAVTAVYSCLFIVILVIDLEHGLILNKVVYPAMGVAVLISVFLSRTEVVPGLGDAAIGGGIGLVLFLAIVLISRGGMGWGDVKLAALVGLVTGFPLIVVALFLAMISGGVLAAVLLTLRVKQRGEGIPFAPFLSVATIITLLWGADILSWYQEIFNFEAINALTYLTGVV
jgi:leader peptidase (prepilin peptidase)/N-methyltransferase